MGTVNEFGPEVYVQVTVKPLCEQAAGSARAGALPSKPKPVAATTDPATTNQRECLRPLLIVSPFILEPARRRPR
jgi:hypothetical protein